MEDGVEINKPFENDDGSRSTARTGWKRSWRYRRYFGSGRSELEFSGSYRSGPTTSAGSSAPNRDLKGRYRFISREGVRGQWVETEPVLQASETLRGGRSEPMT